MHNARSAHQNESGMALAAVLGFLAVISLLVLAVVQHARSTTVSAFRHLARAQAQAAIESGIEYASETLASARGTIPRILQAPEVVEVGGYRVKLTVRPERAKVDLNFADQSLLSALFRSAGAAPEKADALAAAVEDWRDGDDLLQLNGAEQKQYLSAGLSYGPENKLFESVGELRNVYGMTREIFDCVRPQLTILTQAPGVEPAAADPALQRELGLEPQQASGQSSPSVTSDQLIAPGEVYEIIAELEDSKSKLRRAERAAVRITGNVTDPYWLLTIEPEYPLREAAMRTCRRNAQSKPGQP